MTRIRFGGRSGVSSLSARCRRAPAWKSTVTRDPWSLGESSRIGAHGRTDESDRALYAATEWELARQDWVDMNADAKSEVIGQRQANALHDGVVSHSLKMPGFACG
ncbi:hypothetical protein SAMN04489717_4256 [Actinopolymorpha singaporensis]|uniref:Uncharacterized protein n=1 Tax=Actinopolymorpha singaporensis TaxID=117157 RepID=A0A1H1VXR9_9ACTN|nr:hypothetical protein SAMN04489717_4256 [Actinopolymorpha singaporensis]